MPPTIYVDMRGVNAALKRLDDATAGLKLSQAARAGGLEIAGEWKRTFRRKGDPSIAGKPPRRKTGTYSRSVHVQPERHNRTSASVLIGTSLTNPPYPKFLEFGTSKMRPHPIARPALARSRVRAREKSKAALKTLMGIP